MNLSNTHEMRLWCEGVGFPPHPSPPPLLGQKFSPGASFLGTISSHPERAGYPADWNVRYCDQLLLRLRCPAVVVRRMLLKRLSICCKNKKNIPYQNFQMFPQFLSFGDKLIK